ncbi:MAG: divalent-cation tolerance protein CutA [bacterium]
MAAEILFVHTAVDDRPAAKKMARELLKKKLAGCINVGSPVTSYYCWEGKKEETTEYPLLIKTTPEKVEELKNWLAENHPYDCPEIVSTPVEDVNENYLAWLEQQVNLS